MSITVTPGSPIVITGTTAASEKITDDIVSVKFVYWYNPTTAAHLFSLTTKNGERVAKGYCEAAHRPVIVPVLTQCNGLYCDDLDSGELHIYIK